MTDTEAQMWMVVTLKSGHQFHTRVTEYTVKHHPISEQFTGMSWTTHEDSPTRLTRLDLEQVAMVHTEFAPPTT